MTTKTLPICKTLAPELYVGRNAHRRRAARMSYHYPPIDDYIIQNFGKISLRQMAVDLDEYYSRIQYRYDVLRHKGLIMSKRQRNTLEQKIEAMENQMVMTYMEAQKLKAKLAKADEAKQKVGA